MYYFILFKPPIATKGFHRACVSEPEWERKRKGRWERAKSNIKKITLTRNKGLQNQLARKAPVPTCHNPAWHGLPVRARCVALLHCQRWTDLICLALLPRVGVGVGLVEAGESMRISTAHVVVCSMMNMCIYRFACQTHKRWCCGMGALYTCVRQTKRLRRAVYVISRNRCVNIHSHTWTRRRGFGNRFAK